MNILIGQDFIKDIESRYFRTNTDTGANHNALFIWNLVREKAGLPRLERDDLPAYCVTHNKYHIIHTDYGCVRSSVASDRAVLIEKVLKDARQTLYRFLCKEVDNISLKDKAASIIDDIEKIQNNSL